MVSAFQNRELHPDNYKKYQRIFAISNAVKDDVTKKGFGDIMVIENGIPCEEIKCKGNANRGDTTHIVQVSRIFFHQKRQDLAVHALSLLKSRLNTEFKNQASKLKVQKCVMHFVGDGPDMGQLKEMVSQLGLEDDVVFEGLKDRNWVFDHLRDYDLFLQPSDNEGFGLTVAEACAAKVPVLVSNVDGPLEVIDGGKLGMVFRHSDADDLADKLFQFIRDGYDTSIVEKAYQNTLEHYSIAKTTQRYIEEYKKVINNQKQ
jgi:glycosyltransferase involved in cell wall biosynthesis